MGIDSYLILPQGHCYIAFDGGGGRTCFLETTCIGEEESCSVDWRNHLFDYSKSLKIAYSKLSPANRIKFDRFAYALEYAEHLGPQSITKLIDLVENGDKKEVPPLAKLLEQHHQEKSLDDAAKLLTQIAKSYFVFLPVNDARAAGIRPIPVPAEVLAKPEFKLPERKN
jgi:hypothetical protein